MNLCKRALQRIMVAVGLAMAGGPALASNSTESWGKLARGWADANLGDLYYVIVGGFALFGIWLTGYGFFGLYARGKNPQDYKMGTCVGAILLGGALLVVPVLAVVGASSASLGNQELPDFMN